MVYCHSSIIPTQKKTNMKSNHTEEMGLVSGTGRIMRQGREEC